MSPSFALGLLLAAASLAGQTHEPDAAAPLETSPVVPLIQLGGAIEGLLPGNLPLERLPSGLSPSRSTLVGEADVAHDKLAVIAARAKIASTEAMGQAYEAVPELPANAQDALKRVSRALEGVSERTLRAMPIEELARVSEDLLVELQGGRTAGNSSDAGGPSALRDATFVSGLSGPRAPAKATRHAGVSHEMSVDARLRLEVPRYFYSFEEYMEAVLHHPRWGYYTSGRVTLGAGGDFNTYPIGASPYFGQAVAEHAFLMWRGMRAHGSLGQGETFEVAEFGGGDGSLARDFLGHVRSKAQGGDERWKDFVAQLRYTIYERSPALQERQRANNAEFGALFRSEAADARLASASGEGLKGLVLSNELVDAFGVHRVLFSSEGAAEAAFVMPSLDAEALDGLRSAGAPSPLVARIERSGRTLREKLALGNRSRLYLDKEAFDAVMGFIASLPDDARRGVVARLSFDETFVPAAAVPSLAAHLKAHARDYAEALVRPILQDEEPRPVLVHVNTAADGYMETAARLLRAGYVMTIDYGRAIEDLIRNDHGHLRTYRQKKTGYDPYETPTLIDMTTDVDFTALADAGARAGLRLVFFGQQKTLGDIIDVQSIAASLDPVADKTRLRWLNSLARDTAFRVLVQQKEGTDPGYAFSQKSGLALNRRDRAAIIEARLRAVDVR